MHNIGQKVKELREKRNYTQEYMAEQLGITQGSYSKIEQNKSNPPNATKRKRNIEVAY